MKASEKILLLGKLGIFMSCLGSSIIYAQNDDIVTGPNAAESSSSDSDSNNELSSRSPREKVSVNINNNVNNSDKPLIVDGQGIEEEEVGDQELEYLDTELSKQSNQIQLNQKKTTKYKKLQKTTEKLSNVTEKYVEEKKASEGVIKEYNLKIKCLMDEAGLDPDCEEQREALETANSAKNPNKDEVKTTQSALAAAPLAQAQVPSSTNTAPVQQQAAAPIIIQNMMPAATKEETKIESEKFEDDLYPSLDDSKMSSNLDVDNEVEQPKQASDKLKVIPFLAMTNYEGDGISGVKTDSQFGIKLESKNYGRFSLGVGFQRKSLVTNDVGGYSNTIYPSPYFGVYGSEGREVQLTATVFDIYGKFHLLQDSAFLPYFSAGIGYDMTELEYSNSQSYSYSLYNYGGESVSANYVSGFLGAGLDYLFNESVGANFELNFARGLNNLSEGSANQTYPDLMRLQELSRQFSESNTYTIQVGVAVFF